MANDRLRRLMQESLDEVLTPEERQELDKTLERDPRSTQEFNQLKNVDRLLRNAPHERAPQRLAATIMARLAATMKTDLQNEVQRSGELSAELEVSRELIAIALSLVTIATMPMLVAASWLILNSAAKPELLDRVMEQIVALMLLVVKVLQVFLERAQALIESDPEMAAALLALMPVALLGIARFLLGDDDGEGEETR